MDVIFRSIGDNMLQASSLSFVLESIQACDPSEAALAAAPQFLESVYADHSQVSRANSRAATPMLVRLPPSPSAASEQLAFSFVNSRIQVHNKPASPCPGIPGSFPTSPHSMRQVSETQEVIGLQQR